MSSNPTSPALLKAEAKLNKIWAASPRSAGPSAHEVRLARNIRPLETLGPHATTNPLTSKEVDDGSDWGHDFP